MLGRQLQVQVVEVPVHGLDTGVQVVGHRLCHAGLGDQVQGHAAAEAEEALDKLKSVLKIDDQNLRPDVLACRDRALELIERERVTNFVGVPTMSWDLLEAPTFDQRDTSSLTAVGGGGAHGLCCG